MPANHGASSQTLGPFEELAARTYERLARRFPAGEFSLRDAMAASKYGPDATLGLLRLLCSEGWVKEVGQQRWALQRITSKLQTRERARIGFYER